MDDLHYASAILQIRSFHLFSMSIDHNSLRLIQLYNSAVIVLNTVAALDKNLDLVLFCPDYVLQTALLAAGTLLKIVRSSLSDNIDMQCARSGNHSAQKPQGLSRS